MKNKLYDLMLVLGIGFIAIIYMISACLLFEMITDVRFEYQSKMFMIIEFFVFVVMLFYTTKVLIGKRIKAMKKDKDISVRSFFVSFGILSLIFLIVKAVNSFIYRDSLSSYIVKEALTLNFVYPYLFIFCGLYSSFRYLKKKIHKTMSLMAFSLIFIQLIFRETSSLGIIASITDGKISAMGFLVWSEIFLVSALIILIRGGYIKTSLHDKKSVKE